MKNRPQVFIAANFNGTKLRPEYHDGRIWLPASDLARALGYSSTKALTVLAGRLKGQIKPIRLKVWTNGGHQAMTAFSPRDCMEIARRCRAPNRVDFFNWIDAGGLMMLESERA